MAANDNPIEFLRKVLSPIGRDDLFEPTREVLNVMV